MEDRTESQHGAGVVKKSRSLDVCSLYEARGAGVMEGNKLKRKAIVGDHDGGGSGGKRKKKKIVKEVSLSSLKNASLDFKKIAGTSSGLHGSEGEKIDAARDSNDGATVPQTISSLSLNGDVLQIPRKKRGLVGRKKPQGVQSSKKQDEPCGKADLVDQTSKLIGNDFQCEVATVNVEKNDSFDEFNKNCLSSNSSKHADQVTVGNGGSPLKKRRKGSKTKKLAKDGNVNGVNREPLVGNSITVADDSKKPEVKKLRRRKLKKLALDGKAVVKEAECSVDNSTAVCNDSPEDDQQNLEENAAMMLSSRFDTSCTGYSTNKGSPLQFLLPSDHDFVSRKSSPLSESESLSVDAAGRVLRPRTQHKDKGLFRKRRHFYEVFLRDLEDEIWMLNRRIKVFWPLDQIWYYGLVNDYDKERKLHHVKYDDRDEEWINLQSERFKLLLLPGEVPSKSDKSSDQMKGSLDCKVLEEKKGFSFPDDNCVGTSYMDSEPIISWLAQSSHRVKSPFRALKKKKTSDLSSQPFVRDVGSVRKEKRKASRNSSDAMKEDSTSESISGSKDSKMPIVYVRRRLRNTDQELSRRLKEDRASLEDVDRKKDLRKRESGKPLWSVDDAGLLKLMRPGFESGMFNFLVIFPTLSVPFGMRDLWLLHASTLLRCGTVMIMFPQVYLEMLFVDNVVGLRFLRFEGCLNQALAIVFLVFTAFSRPTERAKIVKLQTPVTSIRFKLTCFQNLGKQLVFAFYNYAEVEPTKWMYLDWKLESRRCLLTKQLPLCECSPDNVQDFQNKPVHLSRELVSSKPSFIKVKQMKSVSSLDPSLSPTSVKSFFVSLHLKLLLDPSLPCINFQERNTEENREIYGHEVPDDGHFTKECLNKSSEAALEEKRDVASDACLSSSLRTNFSICSDGNHPINCETVSDDSMIPEELRTNGSISSELDRPKNLVDRDKPENGAEPFPTGLSVEIPNFNQFEKSQQPMDLSWTFPSPNPTAPRSTGQRNKHSSSMGSHLSHGWSEGKADHIYNGFGNGPKKPRTQVSYSLPSGGFDPNTKQKSTPKGTPKRIRKASTTKKPSDVSRGSQKNLEALSCDVNILVTASDRGWRESGVTVVLELFERSEWRLAVKLSSETKYSYKAHQFLQPGSTNRFTHAMMWKGGKDWILEFPDRAQWALFKEMHEECYNRNVRVASLKSIPIPGVCVVEENDDNGTEIAFVRSSCKYFRQVQSDIEMALDPLLVLYDMDSDDERWIHSSCLKNVSDEMFEKMMDVFEKAAYAQKRDHLTVDELEELMVEIGPMEVIKDIYEHWREKRQKLGMPLIRHLQPPLWQRYQQQLREWELAMAKTNPSFPNGYLAEKPPMFAFCMKPRGLEVPNKGSKQRSHRKISVSAHHNMYHDGFHTYGRRFNNFSYSDERYVYSGDNYDSYDDSPSSQMTPRDHSFRKFRRNKSRNDKRRVSGDRNGHRRRDLSSSEQQSIIERQFEGADLDEFRMRSASSAAHRAHTTARVKRERAQRLMCRADLAVHKAVAAIMTAEASKGGVAEDSDETG